MRYAMALSDYDDDIGADDMAYSIGRRRVRRRRPEPEPEPERPRRRRRRLRRAQRGGEAQVVRREKVVRRGRRGEYRDEGEQQDPFGPEPTEPPAAEVDEQIEEVITEVIEDPSEEAAVELGYRLRQGWGPIVRVGNLRIQARAGMRAAVLELKPGLYCVAEVPAGAVEQRPDEFGGPIKMATKIVDAVKDAISRPQPVTVAQRIAGRCKCRWEDS